MTKALGMTVYLRDASGTHTTLFTSVCAVSVDGGGIEASMESQEPCLDDTIVYEYPGDPKYAQQTIEYKKIAGSSGISVDMEQAVLDTTLCEYALKIPLTTPIYATRTAYAMSHTDNAKERNQDMKSSIVFAPQSPWSYSTTAPTTS